MIGEDDYYRWEEHLEGEWGAWRPAARDVVKAAREHPDIEHLITMVEHLFAGILLLREEMELNRALTPPRGKYDYLRGLRS